MKLSLILYFLYILFFTTPVYAHTFTGMIGFYDGLSHPVLGMDHFLAMVSVGIVSAQMGGRAMWTVPAMFVTFMVVGGIVGIVVEINEFFQFEDNGIFIANFISFIIELGIIFSVIFLGLAIAIEKKLSTNITMIFVAIFGLFHGLAHGLEMPWAINPILFALGFTAGTATLHLFGVGIGSIFTRGFLSSILLRLLGACCSIIGFYFLIEFF